MVRGKGGSSKEEREKQKEGKGGSSKKYEEVVRNMRKGIASIHASSG